eukprot:c20943_g1_i5 orf=220-765(+)
MQGRVSSFLFTSREEHPWSWDSIEEELQEQTTRLFGRLFPGLPKSFVSEHWGSRRRYRWTEEEGGSSLCHVVMVFPTVAREDPSDLYSTWARLVQDGCMAKGPVGDEEAASRGLYAWVFQEVQMLMASGGSSGTDRILGSRTRGDDHYSPSKPSAKVGRSSEEDRPLRRYVGQARALFQSS